MKFSLLHFLSNQTIELMNNLFQPKKVGKFITLFKVSVYIQLTNSSLIFPLPPQLQQEKGVALAPHLQISCFHFWTVMAEDQYSFQMNTEDKPLKNSHKYDSISLRDTGHRLGFNLNIRYFRSNNVWLNLNLCNFRSDDVVLRGGFGFALYGQLRIEFVNVVAEWWTSVLNSFYFRWFLTNLKQYSWSCSNWKECKSTSNCQCVLRSFRRRTCRSRAYCTFCYVNCWLQIHII